MAFRGRPTATDPTIPALGTISQERGPSVSGMLRKGAKPRFLVGVKSFERRRAPPVTDAPVATARGFRVPTRVEFYIVWVAEAPDGNVSPQARPRRMSLLRK